MADETQTPPTETPPVPTRPTPPPPNPVNLSGLNVRTDAAQPGDIQAAPLANETPVGGYTAGTWNTLPNFECGSCPLATLNEDEMRAHVATFHPQAAG